MVDVVQLVCDHTLRLSRQASISPPTAEIVDILKSITTALWNTEEQYAAEHAPYDRDALGNLTSKMAQLGIKHCQVIIEIHDARDKALEDEATKYNRQVERFMERIDRDEPTDIDHYFKRYYPLSNNEDIEEKYDKLMRQAEEKFKERSALIDQESDRENERLNFATERRSDGFKQAFADTLSSAFHAYLKFIAPYQPSTPSHTTVPLLNVIAENPARVLNEIMKSFSYSLTPHYRMFAEFLSKVDANRKRAEQTINANWLTPSTHLSPDEVINAFFKGTEMRSLFDAHVAAPEAEEPQIAEEHWYRHCLLLATTGNGKTNAVGWRLTSLLPQIAQGKASAIVMEPKGVLISQLLHLAEVWNMRDRVIIVDPADSPVTVNLFDKGDGSDQALRDAMAMVDYLISTLSAELTDLQHGPLAFIIRLLFAIPGPVSIETFDHILRNGAKGNEEHLAKLDSRAATRFFTLDWDTSQQVKGNAAQLLARLNNLLANPLLEKLFYSDRTTLNIFDALQSGRLVLINANSDTLGEGRPTEMYGRFWIAQIYKAALRRLALLRQGGTLIPCAFIIDEAQEFIGTDQRLASILGQARQALIGTMFAMHHMGDIDDQGIRDSIYTNTALKFVAQTSADIHNLCRSMGNTKPEFIGALNEFEFAHSSPTIRTAIKVKFPLVEFDKMPQMSRMQYEALRAANRLRYSYQPKTDTPAAPVPLTSESPVEEILAKIRESIAEDQKQPTAAVIPTEPPQRDPPMEDGSRQERPPRSTTVHPAPTRPAATQSDKPAGTEGAREW
jgi:hypothetical protein